MKNLARSLVIAVLLLAALAAPLASAIANGAFTPVAVAPAIPVHTAMPLPQVHVVELPEVVIRGEARTATYRVRMGHTPRTVTHTVRVTPLEQGGSPSAPSVTRID